MIRRKQQQGMTAISLVVVLGVLAFFVMLAFVLLPIYIENFDVESHMERMGENSDLSSMTEDEILRTLFKRFDIDNVKNVKPEDVIVEQEGDNVIVTVDYEVRAPIMGNIDVVVFFQEKMSTSE